MLSNRQVCIFKYLYPDKRINENELYKHFNVNIEDKVIQALLKNKLIFIDSSQLYQPKLIYLTEQGIAYIENLLTSETEKKSHNIHEWINTIISGLALITAIIALIVSIVKW